METSHSYTEQYGVQITAFSQGATNTSLKNRRQYRPMSIDLKRNKISISLMETSHSYTEQYGVQIAAFSHGTTNTSLKNRREKNIIDLT
jgi:hypothetical protein